MKIPNNMKTPGNQLQIYRSIVSDHGAYLVCPVRTNPDDFCDHSEISCRKNPALNTQLVVEIVDDFGVLEN